MTKLVYFYDKKLTINDRFFNLDWLFLRDSDV